MMIDALMQLLGRWEGEGLAFFPTITQQDYVEHLSFTYDEPHDVIQYEQKTWRKHNGLLLHWEFGFIRMLEDQSLVLNNTANNGRVEVMTGQITSLDNGFQVSLNSTLFGNDPRMVKAAREWCIEGDVLTYDHMMVTQTVSSTRPHLRARLRRC
jgi:hypothetical protein